MRQIIVRITSFTLLIIALANCCKIEEPVVNVSRYPFVEEGKEWLGMEDIIYKMEGDTIIRFKSYKKLFKQSFKCYENQDWHYFGCVRQNGGEVYAIKHKENKEVLLYDFSLEESEAFMFQKFGCDGPYDRYKVFGKQRIPGLRTYMVLVPTTNYQLPNLKWEEGLGIYRNPFIGIEDAPDKDY